MCWLTSNPAWLSVIIAALSLIASICAMIAAKKSNKRVEEYNNESIRLKYRPVLDIENGWTANPVENSITFNLIANHNEAKVTKIVSLTNSFVCSQPRSFPIHMLAGDVELVKCVCFLPEEFRSAILSIDIYYEDIIGNSYKTHIEGCQLGLKTTPAQPL